MIRFNHAAPHFAVRDVSAAVSFYSAVLGFGVDYLDGDPPHYAVVYRGEVYIHLSVPENPDFRPGSGRAFIAVSGIDPLWKGASTRAPESVVKPLKNCDYGHGVRFRVFAIADPDGNTLRIGEPIEAD